MGWHMKLVICVQLAYVSVCLTQLSVVREWTSLDVQLKPGDGQESRSSILPSEVYYWRLYKDRMFVTFYRKRKLPLAYLDLTDNSTSALLRPYPSYENQLMTYDMDVVHVDRCDRLWIVSGSSDFTSYMIVFDLKTDSILRNCSSLDLYYSYDMTFDDFDCDNEYVYISTFDAVWTYSWAEDDSWRHNIFSNDIASMILAPNNIVYYNEVGKPMVYYISTTHLKDKNNETIDIRELRRIWKLNLNLDSSALDAKNNVLYYFNYENRTAIHAVPCWTSERCSSNCQDVSIDPTHELSSYITVDKNGDLRAVTIRSSFEDGEINFRLLTVPVNNICVESNAKDTTTTTNINESTTAASSTTEQTSTLGSVPKHTTVNIAHTTAGTPNSNITPAVGGTNMPYLLFSIANVTFNLSNFTINNFPNNHFN